ncbi:Major centromere autoantigen B [Dictyocoela muelleri]|nr:Major centromere autoantigen B [Dictyocoela muelleri]
MKIQKKRKRCTLAEKKDIVQYKKKNPKTTQKELMKKFNLSLGTINEILKNGEEILKEEVGTKFNKRKANFPTNIFDEELFKWFLIKRRRFCTIQDSNLQEMALKLACLYKLDNFKASNGWLQKFKIRHNIKYRSIQGESGLVDKIFTKNLVLNIQKNYLAIVKLVFLIVMKKECFSNALQLELYVILLKIKLVESLQKRE